MRLLVHDEAGRPGASGDPSRVPPIVRRADDVQARLRDLFANAGDWMICGTSDASHASPVATEQSCMLLHRFGVIQTKFDSVLFARSPPNLENGTTLAEHRAAFDTMSV